MDILAVIPARGGSKGIIRKNLRLLNLKPLIYYQIINSLESEFITDVVVTSDDDVILDYSSNFPVSLRRRQDSFAGDNVTLDPVVNDATVYMELENGKKYDVVVTLQPTSPLLSFRTLDNAIKKFIVEDLDTLIPVVDATHLHWKEEGNTLIPDYSERLNRQWLPHKFKETGAFLISKRNFVSMESRFGEKLNIYVLNDLEGLDIDMDVDFLMAEAALKRLKITLVVNGNKNVGMGHIYRSLTLADGFLGHEIKFVTLDSDPASIELIKSRGYSVIESDKASILSELDSSIIINDILDTDVDYMRKLKDSGRFVVNFEDLGDGSKFADLVFNALYARTNPKSNERFGYAYECLNEQFFLYSPIIFKESPETLLVTFGGVDTNNLTLKILDIATKIFEETTINKILIILGDGYSHEINVDDINQKFESTVEICFKVKNMPLLMRDADIAITSNGRTIYELAFMGIPTISIAQNDRETLHVFARYKKGVEYLGISCTVTSDDIYQSVKELVVNNDLRLKMHLKQKEASIVLRNGLNNIKDEITSEYWKWKNEYKEI
jgi:CMP-N-acetylneuraminic acid synthetase/spore coat polysaccharide biosynthesis predicted glycosyltransferase SpsG